MWTYPTTDHQGNYLADDMPFTGVSWSDNLNSGGGSFQGTLELDHPLLSADMRNHAGRMITWPCRDGVPFGAYTWQAGSTVKSDALVQPVTAERADQILKERLICDDLVFTGKEQIDIARDLFRYGCGVGTQFTDTYRVADYAGWARLPWLRLAGGNSAVWRDRTKVINGQDDDGYRAKGRKNVLDAVQQLADNVDGFEFRFDTGRDSAGLFGLIQWGAGFIGRPPGIADRCVFETGGNIVEAQYGWDAKDFATRVDVVGSEAQGTAPVVGSATATDLLAQGYPFRMVSLSGGNTTDLTTLNQRAAAELAVRSQIKDGYTVTLDGSREPMLGTYGIGDHVTLRVLRPAGLDERIVRITGWSIKVHDSRMSETVSPVLAARAW